MTAQKKKQKKLVHDKSSDKESNSSNEPDEPGGEPKQKCQHTRQIGSSGNEGDDIIEVDDESDDDNNKEGGLSAKGKKLKGMSSERELGELEDSETELGEYITCALHVSC